VTSTPNVTSAPKAASAPKASPAPEVTSAQKASPAPDVTSAQKPNAPSRYIPRALKQTVFFRAKNQCEFQDPVTGRRCSAKHHLEIDHVHALALGGTTTLENLRVLCRSHNQWQALQSFGREKMQSYWT